jgi:phenylalanyl-tRNA synthetase beta chain
LYEFGHCYFIHRSDSANPKADNYTEKAALDIFLTGNTERQAWNSKTNPTDFFNIKSAVEMVLARLGILPRSLPTGESSKKYFAESVSYLHKNKTLAEAGRISKKYLSQFDISQDVYYGHIDQDLLLEIIRDHSISFCELPKYPSVRRDLALLLDRSVKFSQIREIALHTERNILREIQLFDVYESDTLGKNKKSYAVSFVLRDDLRTLTDKNIDKVMDNLIRAFGRELNASIR